MHLPRINSTISVFGALLFFHTFEELLEHYVFPVRRHGRVTKGEVGSQKTWAQTICL
jgi:hypothetical protein